MKYIKIIWNDPVGSKVIAVLICYLVSILWTSDFFKNSINFFSFSVVIETILFTIWLLAIVVLLRFLWRLKDKIFAPSQKRTLNSVMQEPYSGKLPRLHDDPVAFFAGRLAKAFPGQRGIKWYNDKESVTRLEILLKHPLLFKRGNSDNAWIEPVSWYRGNSNNSIKYFEKLSKTKFLMDIYEIEVNRIAVLIESSEYKNFVYVEAKSEKSLTLRGKESVREQVDYYGYANEEYAIYKGKVISRPEFDDGAALIKGKVVETAGQQELRVRYLSKYNFIIASKQSPFNSRKFDAESAPIFLGILKGTHSPEDLFRLMEEYRRDDTIYRNQFD